MILYLNSIYSKDYIVRMQPELNLLIKGRSLICVHTVRNSVVIPSYSVMMNCFVYFSLSNSN
jgi:hypothetical protein